MNRLIIIGNGFDLAHGLKTSSKDLLIYYFSNIWSNLSLGSFDDNLITIKQAKKFVENNYHTFSNINSLQLFKSIVRSGSYNLNDAHLQFRSNFFKAIFNKINYLKWADFETEYFNELFYIIEESNKFKNTRANYDRFNNEHTVNKSVKLLNDNLDDLKDLLIKHLIEQQAKFESQGKTDHIYINLFEEPIYYGEKVKKTKIEYPELIHYLNFNYTNTLSKYGITSDVNHIHGTLNNEPIFGFGDDTSDKYNELENQYNNEFLKKIKSFRYLDNSKHRELMTFLNSDYYQVHIYGHSCGVSDRTLFKQIFENDKCRSIKIFYHNRNDFEDKKYEISRHFTDKRLFLEKVVSFDNLRPMPQVEQSFI